MKNYSIEIELIDKTGKNLNKDIKCSINDSSIKKSKSNTYVYKEKFEDSEKKQTITILLDEKELVLNLVLDLEDEKIIEKKTKLYVKDGRKKIEIDRETITEDIAWDIDEKKPFITIRAIYDEDDAVEDDISEVEEENEVEENPIQEVEESKVFSEVAAIVNNIYQQVVTYTKDKDFKKSLLGRVSILVDVDENGIIVLRNKE